MCVCHRALVFLCVFKHEINQHSSTFSLLSLSLSLSRKAFAALLALENGQLPRRQEPSGTLQELQRSHAHPRGGVRRRLFRGRWHRYQTTLRLRDDVLPGGERLCG